MYFRRRAGKGGGKAKDILFVVAEMRARLKSPNIAELFFDNRVFFSADGRMNVNSKRAADEHRRLEHRQSLQPRSHFALRFDVHVHP